MTYNADGTASRKLLDTLGLPLDTPVVEWHRWDVPSAGQTTTQRFHLPSTLVAANISPGFSSEWEHVNVNGNSSPAPAAKRMTLTQGTTPVQATVTAWTNAAATLDVLAMQFVSDEVIPTARTITGTLSAAICNYVSTTANISGFVQFIVRVVSADGSTVRGVLCGPNAATTTGAAGSDTAQVDQSNPRMRYWTDVPLNPVAAEAGDRIVVEVGVRHLADGSALGSAIQLWLGEVGSGDPNKAPAWVELNSNADLSAATPSVGWVLDEDRTAALVAYQTTHGRPSPLDNTGPLTASVALARDRLTDPLPTSGERFRLTLNADVADALGIDEAERPRFTGEITDVDVNAEGVLSLVQVAGIGRSSRLGRVPVLTRRTGELDGERVRRVLYQAAITLPLDLGTFDPGTVTLLSSDYTEAAENARSIIDGVTQDSLGQLVEHRSGRLDWHDAEHRRDTPSLVTLTGPDHIIKPFRWAQSIGTVVNDAAVTYGDAAGAEGRATVRVTDYASADVDTGLGPYGVQLDTQLATREDAYALASLIVGRYASPSWMLPDLTVDVVRTAADRAGAVLSLSHGDKITATGLPPDGAFEAGDLFVEGTTETFVRTAWRVSLAVADPAIAGVGVRWLDLDLATDATWGDVDPGMTWLDAATAAPVDF